MKDRECVQCGSVLQVLSADLSFCLDCDWDDLPIVKGGFCTKLVQSGIDYLVKHCGFPESSVAELKRVLPKNERLALEEITKIKELPVNIRSIRFVENFDFGYTEIFIRGEGVS